MSDSNNVYSLCDLNVSRILSVSSARRHYWTKRETWKGIWSNPMLSHSSRPLNCLSHQDFLLEGGAAQQQHVTKLSPKLFRSKVKVHFPLRKKLECYSTHPSSASSGISGHLAAVAYLFKSQVKGSWLVSLKFFGIKIGWRDEWSGCELIQLPFDVKWHVYIYCACFS